MNEPALKRVLARARMEAQTEPGSASRATPGTAADPPQPPAGPLGSADPQARLWSLLDAWAGMDEAAWTQEAVNRLRDEILDVFQAHPGAADGWFREWRQLHPEARLG